jgi:hypothetical protein
MQQITSGSQVNSGSGGIHLLQLRDQGDCQLGLESAQCRSRTRSNEPGSKITPNHAGLPDGAALSSTR